MAFAENQNNRIDNCYNYGALTGSSETNASAITLSPSDKTSVSNCYYLYGTAPEQVFTDKVAAKSADQYASGKV